MKRTWVSYVAVAALGLSSLAGCAPPGEGEVGEQQQGLQAQWVIANMSPAGVVQSTGNLYWTNNTVTLFPRRVYSASVYRSSKTSNPGQETVLYSESSSLPVSFGNITWGLVDGVYYGYFVATYRTGSVIKRVPLAGGSAVTVTPASAQVSAGSQLAIDGTNIYFYDAVGLNVMDVHGSTPYRLVSAPNIVGFVVAPVDIYYGSGNSLWAMHKDGSGNTALVTQNVPIKFVANTTARNSDNSTAVFYGTDSGVTSYNGNYLLGGAAPSGHHITSLGWDGTRILWTECSSTNTSCSIGYRSANDFLPYSVPASDGARSILGDATQLYYVSSTEFIRGAY